MGMIRGEESGDPSGPPTSCESPRGHHRFTNERREHHPGDQRPDRRVADELHEAVDLRCERDLADQEVVVDEWSGLMGRCVGQARQLRRR
jgi:hypothetical protein